MKTVEPQIVRAIFERQALKMKAQFFRALADAYDPRPRDGADVSHDPRAPYPAQSAIRNPKSKIASRRPAA
jgi:hypothetical protein